MKCTATTAGTGNKTQFSANKGTAQCTSRGTRPHVLNITVAGGGCAAPAYARARTHGVVRLTQCVHFVQIWAFQSAGSVTRDRSGPPPRCTQRLSRLATFRRTRRRAWTPGHMSEDSRTETSSTETEEEIVRGANTHASGGRVPLVASGAQSLSTVGSSLRAACAGPAVPPSLAQPLPSKRNVRDNENIKRRRLGTEAADVEVVPRNGQRRRRGAAKTEARVALPTVASLESRPGSTSEWRRQRMSLHSLSHGVVIDLNRVTIPERYRRCRTPLSNHAIAAIAHGWAPDDVCSICGLGGDIVCCDECPMGYHLQCIGLPSIPSGEWFCPACVLRIKVEERMRQELGLASSLGEHASSIPTGWSQGWTRPPTMKALREESSTQEPRRTSPGIAGIRGTDERFPGCGDGMSEPHPPRSGPIAGAEIESEHRGLASAATKERNEAAVLNREVVQTIQAPVEDAAKLSPLESAFTGSNAAQQPGNAAPGWTSSIDEKQQTTANVMRSFVTHAATHLAAVQTNVSAGSMSRDVRLPPLVPPLDTEQSMESMRGRYASRDMTRADVASSTYLATKAQLADTPASLPPSTSTDSRGVAWSVLGAIAALKLAPWKETQLVQMALRQDERLIGLYRSFGAEKDRFRDYAMLLLEDVRARPK